ncbi:MAG: 16S rRNA (guanine(966)-N(2))-methyltransferase RsmD [Clostridiales bacterium]|nr:16S rRNA (guanine(966)-N(2))-methyltransferase RsmD [Clostridiales bacterium]
MRIITGSAKGAKLEALEGEETRPTAERVKEAVFSMIQFDIEGRRVLDLFAGSGQMGLEALSRGAERAVFTDSNPHAVEIIKANAQKIGLFKRCSISCTDYARYIRSAAGEKFDIIFLDPPYGSDLLEDALKMLTAADLVADNGYVICETDSPTPLSAEGMRLKRHYKYGRIYISLLTKEASDDESGDDAE